MSAFFQVVEIFVALICIYLVYYFSNNSCNTCAKEVGEKEKSDSKVDSLLSKSKDKKDSKTPSVKSESTCVEDSHPMEKGESTYRNVESLPIDDENSQKISTRKDLLDKSPAKDH
uniref:Uncharacterized protein n=1 Tax=Parastrongyloides trichosuri TaxID=131310 RepID=A0A0N5A5J1_PARTI